jgi:hypothetical protein
MNYYWEQLPHDLMGAALLFHPHLRDAVPLTMESKMNAGKFVIDYILQTHQGSPGCRNTTVAVSEAMPAYIKCKGQFARPECCRMVAAMVRG